MKLLFKPADEVAIFDFSNVVFRACAVGGEYYVSRFCDMMVNYRKRLSFHKFVIAIEGRGTEERQTIFPAYKAGRTKDPEIELCRKNCLSIMKCTKCQVIKAPKGEADDAIACYLRIKSPNRVTIISEDKDLWQLVKPGKCSILSKRRGDVTPETVKSVLGVPPSKVVLYKAVFGDPSDGLPRVPQVPAKQLLDLVQRSTSVETLLQNAAGIKSSKVSDQILKCKTQIERTYNLAKLREELRLIDHSYEPNEKKLRVRLRKHSVMLSDKDISTLMEGFRP